MTAALYGAAALAVLHAAGLLGAQLWSTLAGDARRMAQGGCACPQAAPRPSLSFEDMPAYLGRRGFACISARLEGLAKPISTRLDRAG